MKITNAEAHCYRVPLKNPWGDSTHQVTHIELIITRIDTDSGQDGIGFSYTVGSGGTAVQPLIGDYLVPRLVGRDPAQVERLWTQLWEETHDVGGGGIAMLALSSIDTSLWDLKAKAVGQPLHRLLGGSRDRIMGYGSGVNLNLSIDELLAQVERWLSRGYQAVKVKVGSDDPEEDVDRLRRVRELIGPKSWLMVDANQKWTATETIARIKLLDRFNLFWVEEPLIADDIPGHAWVRSNISPPIAIGENVYSKYQFNNYITSGGADIIQADVARVGGITEWLKIAHMAQSFNLKMAPHFILELSGQMLCAVPNALILEDVEGGSLTELGVLKNPLQPKEGYWTPPALPGHGIEFDWEALATYEVRPGAVTDVTATRHSAA